MNLMSEEKQKAYLWTRTAQQALYMVAFGAVIGAVGFLIPAIVNGTLAASAGMIGLGLGIGLLAAMGSTYLNGKIEAAIARGGKAKVNVPEKCPEPEKANEIEQEDSRFRDYIDASRAAEQTITR